MELGCAFFFCTTMQISIMSSIEYGRCIRNGVLPAVDTLDNDLNFDNEVSRFNKHDDYEKENGSSHTLFLFERERHAFEFTSDQWRESTVTVRFFSFFFRWWIDDHQSAYVNLFDFWHREIPIDFFFIRRINQSRWEAPRSSVSCWWVHRLQLEPKSVQVIE